MFFVISAFDVLITVCDVVATPIMQTGALPVAFGRWAGCPLVQLSGTDQKVLWADWISFPISSV